MALSGPSFAFLARKALLRVHSQRINQSLPIPSVTSFYYSVVLSCHLSGLFTKGLFLELLFAPLPVSFASSCLSKSLPQPTKAFIRYSLIPGSRVSTAFRHHRLAALCNRFRKAGHGAPGTPPPDGIQHKNRPAPRPENPGPVANVLNNINPIQTRGIDLPTSPRKKETDEVGFR